MSTLHTELATFEQRLPQMLVSHAGEFVVIQGTTLHEYLPTYEQALDWAYDKFGLGSFFVRKVTQEPDLVHFTRDLGPCRPGLCKP